MPYKDPEKQRAYNKEYGKKYRATHPSKKPSKEKQQEYGKTYSEKHPGKRKEIWTNYRNNNREEINARQRQSRIDNPEKSLLKEAIRRAKKDGIPITIDVEDICIPQRCPLLGIELFKSDGMVGPNSPSLDRIEPSKGYVPGNIWVISHRANRIKYDSSFDELNAIAIAVRKVSNAGGVWHPFSEYKRNADGYGQNPIAVLLGSAKRRCKKRNIEFAIDHSDIVIPDVCPVLGIPLNPAKGCQTHNSPSLDRIDPSKGYVKGNVWVISWRANSIKSDASLYDLETIAENWRRLTINKK